MTNTHSPYTNFGNRGRMEPSQSSVAVCSLRSRGQTLLPCSSLDLRGMRAHMSMTVVPIVFRFPGALAPAANHVAILGPWNGWNPRAHVLTKDPQGFWTITLYLPPGRTIYCFNVD